MMDNSIQTALSYGKQVLLAEESEAIRSAEILLQHSLEVSRTYLYAHSDQTLSQYEYERYQTMLAQRKQGMPIAYITGQRSFWTFELGVSTDTLIPRSETELLVERSLALADPLQSMTVLDLGTGSGAIALALASERPHWRITACDQSAPALAIAEKNARSLQITSIQFVLSNWLQAFHQQFDMIVANPPYLSADDPHMQQGDLRFEPQSALVSGQDGLDALRTIIHESYQHLTNQGILLVEHGYNQGTAVRDLFVRYGYQDTHSVRDEQGHLRVCTGRKIL